MNKELIDRMDGMREKLIELLMETFPNASGDRGYYACCADELIANGVTVREKGEWTRTYVDWKYVWDWAPCGNSPWTCSKCGEIVSWERSEPKWKFCPHCGADMRGDT